jgi:hypothetical protein
LTGFVCIYPIMQMLIIKTNSSLFPEFFFHAEVLLLN